MSNGSHSGKVSDFTVAVSKLPTIVFHMVRLARFLCSIMN